MTVSTLSGRHFASLQAAVNAAPNGATIHVSGVCLGPTLIFQRSNLTIEGDPPASCPPGPRDLTSTLRGNPSITPPPSSLGEVIKVLSSTNVTVRFLNIVNGGEHNGLDFRSASTGNSTGGVAHCNCVARNDEGYELDRPGTHMVRDSLVTHNRGSGIGLRRGTANNAVRGNIVEFSGENGIAVIEGGKHNLITDNTARNNGLSGLELDGGEASELRANQVVHNEQAGITLENEADDNVVNDNLIRDNGDGLTNLVQCLGDLSGNTGNNVPGMEACR